MGGSDRSDGRCLWHRSRRGCAASATGGFGLDNSTTVDGENLFQPRFGFNYALDNRTGHKKQIRGGAGLFQGAAASVWLTNPYSNTGMATRIIGCGAAGLSACSSTASNVFSADPNNQPVLPGTIPVLQWFAAERFHVGLTHVV